MKGSLAVWCEQAGEKVNGFRPHIELHFNIWKDVSGRGDAFDVGIQFKEIRTISALKLFIPGEFDLNYISDLSENIKDDNTLSAIFNEIYHVGQCRSAGFEVLNDFEERVMHVLHLGEGKISIEPIRSETECEGNIISFGEELLLPPQRMIGDQYIRFRIFLNHKLTGLFGNRTFPSDIPFIPSFSAIDTVEFRLNERRNFSKYLKRAYPKMVYPRISAINYFLIANRRTEMVRSHENFRKMRLLEPGLWDRYIAQLGEVRAEDLVIYQWRDDRSSEGDVEDFIALAVLRKGYRNSTRYLITVLLVGAGGSALSALVSLVVSDVLEWMLGAPRPLLAGTISLALLMASFALLAEIMRRGVKKL